MGCDQVVGLRRTRCDDRVCEVQRVGGASDGRRYRLRRADDGARGGGGAMALVSRAAAPRVRGAGGIALSSCATASSMRGSITAGDDFGCDGAGRAVEGAVYGLDDGGPRDGVPC